MFLKQLVRYEVVREDEQQMVVDCADVDDLTKDLNLINACLPCFFCVGADSDNVTKSCVRMPEEGFINA